MAPTHKLPLIVIVGPTASGKTALAIELAQEFDGEIICADSRTIYKGMDIGTAKPTPEERATVPHHLIDIVEPNQPFSAADFQRLAYEAIADIRSRGKIPFLVGGTGLYVDGVIFNYRFGGEPDQKRRLKLESMSVQELQNYCRTNNIELPENSKNKRYLVRAIERSGYVNPIKQQLTEDTLVVGIATEKETLKQRITQRAEQLFDSGMLEEAIALGKKYGWDHESMTGNIYRLAKAFYEGAMGLDEVKEKFITLDWRLAKRQLTWLKRNPFIQWGTVQEVRQIVRDYLR